MAPLALPTLSLFTLPLLFTSALAGFFGGGGFGGYGGYGGGFGGGFGGYGGGYGGFGGGVAMGLPLRSPCAASVQCVGVAVCVQSVCACPGPRYMQVGGACRTATVQTSYAVPAVRTRIAYAYPGMSCGAPNACTGGSFCYQQRCCCPQGLIVRGPSCVAAPAPVAIPAPVIPVAPAPAPVIPVRAPCSPGFVAIRTGCAPVRIARPVIRAIQVIPGGPCGGGQECTGGSVCLTGRCCCTGGLQQVGTSCVLPPPPPPPVYVPVAPAPVYVPAPAPVPVVVGTPCVAPTQCGVGAVCNRGACGCSTSYVPIGGICQRRKRKEANKESEGTKEQ